MTMVTTMFNKYYNHERFRTVQEYLQYQEETAIPKLRWLQVRELRKKYPNDADFGHEVAKLIMKDEKR